MKKRIVIIAVICGIVVVFIAFSNILKPVKMSQSASMAQPAPIPVNVVVARKMSIDRSIELTGTLNAWKEIKITAETQGKIEELNFDAGQVKAKGEILSTIDNKLKQLAVATAKVNAIKLKNDLDRIENIYKGGTASQQQLDDARFAYETARIQQEQAEKQLSDATLRSPMAGIITEKFVEQGSYVNIGGPIATIVDISKLRVKLNVSETNVYRLKIGDKVVVTNDVYPGISFNGCITFISSKGDDTHNFPVEITINNNKEYQLKAGSFCTVHIDIQDAQNKLYIPRQALVGSIKEAGIYTVSHGTVSLKSITVGNQPGEHLEVTAGISEGDTIVIEGQINLSDGKSVSVVAL